MYISLILIKEGVMRHNMLIGLNRKKNKRRRRSKRGKKKKKKKKWTILSVPSHALSLHHHHQCPYTHLGPSTALATLGRLAREPTKRNEGGGVGDEGNSSLSWPDPSCSTARPGPMCASVHPGPHPTLKVRPMNAPMSARQR